MEVSPGDYNVSRVGPSGGLVTMTSNLGLRATESSLVECLASVTALARPLSSHVHITVGEELRTHTRTHTAITEITKWSQSSLSVSKLCRTCANPASKTLHSCSKYGWVSNAYRFSPLLVDPSFYSNLPAILQPLDPENNPNLFSISYYIPIWT